MLKEMKCRPDGPQALKLGEIMNFMKEISEWSLENGHLVKYFQFPGFEENMDFVKKIAEIALAEQHHPVLLINRDILKVELWTTSINALSENDFIIAGKIDAIAS